MISTSKRASSREQTDSLIKSVGVRITRQRRAVLDTILNSKDHPTASLIFQRAATKTRGLSLATVYNCLETLAQAHIINQLNFDNGPARFCPNLIPHAHFVDTATGEVYDVHLKPGICPEDVFDLPEGVKVKHMDVYMQGSVGSESDQ